MRCFEKSMMWIWRLFWCFCTWHRFCAFFKEMQNRQRWLQTCQPRFKVTKIQFLIKSVSLNKFSYILDLPKQIFPSGSPQTNKTSTNNCKRNCSNTLNYLYFLYASPSNCITRIQKKRNKFLFQRGFVAAVNQRRF